MVKKSGFLNKIVGRFRSGSVRVEDKPNTQRRSAAPTNGAKKPAVARAIPEEIIPSSQRKVSQKEAAQLTMNSGFQELSTLLKGVEGHMGDSAGKLDELNTHVSQLPAAAQEQVAMLKTLVGQLEKQNQMNGMMVETFAELPSVMKGVKESLEKSAVTDERTASTLDEFKGTMDRIQGSMGSMVETSQAQADAASAIASDHKEGVQNLESATAEGLEALRKAQEDQANRMAKIATEAGRSNRAVVILLVFGVATMVAIFAAIMNN